MGNIFDIHSIHLYLLILFSLLNSILLIWGSYKYLQVLQLSYYKSRGILHWIRDTKSRSTTYLVYNSLLSFAILLVLNVLSMPFEHPYFASYVGLCFYFGSLVHFVTRFKKEPMKKPLIYTKRVTRLSILMFLFISISSFGLLVLFHNIDVLRFLIFVLYPCVLFLVVMLCNFLLLPIEILIKAFYIFIAKNKLKKYDSLIKIGITGSCGKTSTKNILKTILSEKYNVLITPHSFNTPMGIVKVLRTMLQPNHQILIVEMGAMFKNDIKYICNFVKPTYGIITNVGNQHLESFGSIDLIKKTKFELAEAIPDNGFCIFNLDDEISNELYNIATCNKFYTKTNDESAFITAKDIVIDGNGTSFKIKIKGKKEFNVTTKLLGEHNVQNILEAVAVAENLGLSVPQIKLGLSKIKPVKHRLELVQLDNGAILLDDSFNSNVVGVSSALNVLSKFKNKRKIVITPGLVNLGDRTSAENQIFGEKIAKVADIVYIVNETNKLAINNGLLSAGFDQENIISVSTFKEAWDLIHLNIQADDVILIENDLPDNFI